MRIVLWMLLLSTLFSCGNNSSKGRRVGVDASWYPLSYGNRDSNITGLSTDLLTLIGREEKIPFVKVTVNSEDLLPGLQKDKYEAILSSMTPYLFNEKLYDFSDVYLPLGPVLVVPVNSSIDALGMLQGKEIAIIAGSSYALLLEKIPGALIRNYDSIPQALNAILDNTVDGALIDTLSATAYCQDLYQGQLKVATPPLTDEGLRLITKHDSAPDLIKGFNKGLKRLQKSDAYDKLLSKWGF